MLTGEQTLKTFQRKHTIYIHINVRNTLHINSIYTIDGSQSLWEIFRLCWETLQRTRLWLLFRLRLYNRFWLRLGKKTHFFFYFKRKKNANFFLWPRLWCAMAVRHTSNVCVLCVCRECVHRTETWGNYTLFFVDGIYYIVTVSSRLIGDGKNWFSSHSSYIYDKMYVSAFALSLCVPIDEQRSCLHSVIEWCC